MPGRSSLGDRLEEPLSSKNLAAGGARGYQRRQQPAHAAYAQARSLQATIYRSGGETNYDLAVAFYSNFPQRDQAVALATEDLAWHALTWLLRLEQEAPNTLHRRHFIALVLSQELSRRSPGGGVYSGEQAYASDPDYAEHLEEMWDWLLAERLIIHEPGHQAFKAVEVAVRDVTGQPATAVGVDLMTQAFRKSTGPLADASAPEAEQEAVMHLFRGAYGAFRNPASHRDIDFEDPAEAAEIVLLADLLMRITDRAAARQAP